MNGQANENFIYNLHPELNGENPVIAAIKRFGNTGFLLGIIIARCLGMLISLIFSDAPEMAVFSLIPDILVFSGILAFYVSCRTTKYPGVKPTGLKILYVITIIIASLTGVGGLLAYIGVMSWAGSEELLEFVSKYYGDLPEETTKLLLDKDLLQVIATVAIIAVIIVVLFYIFVAIGLRRVIRTIKTGTFCGKMPVFLTVLLIVVTLFQLITVITNFSNALNFFDGVISLAEYVLWTVLVFKFNSDMEFLWYYNT